MYLRARSDLGGAINIKMKVHVSIMSFLLGGFGDALPTKAGSPYCYIEGHPDFCQFKRDLQSIFNRKDWKALNKSEFLDHDSFNIADGFDLDVFLVEEFLSGGKAKLPGKK